MSFLDGDYDTERFYAAVKGHENDPERGERCRICYRLRLGRTAEEAAAGGFPYFASTLTLSPLKDTEALNAIGEEEGARCGVIWLPSDFKKRNGFLRSCEITNEYGMYRQDYCGCVYSVRTPEAH